MGDVIDLPVVTTIDLDPDRVLKAAEGELEGVIIAGWGKDGEFFYSSSMAAGPECLWLLELAKKKLLEIGDV